VAGASTSRPSSRMARRKAVRLSRSMTTAGCALTPPCRPDGGHTVIGELRLGLAHAVEGLKRGAEDRFVTWLEFVVAQYRSPQSLRLRGELLRWSGGVSRGRKVLVLRGGTGYRPNALPSRPGDVRVGARPVCEMPLARPVDSGRDSAQTADPAQGWGLRRSAAPPRPPPRSTDNAVAPGDRAVRLG